jgi:hypothetical protein
VSGTELRFRCRDKIRVGAEAMAFAWRRPGWDRKRLRSRLHSSSVPLAVAQAALAERDWRVAESALRAHFSRRTCGFLIDPRQRQQVAAAIREALPSSENAAIAAAAPLLEGRFDVLSFRDLAWTTGHGVDWHLDPVHRRRAPRRQFWARVPYLDPRLGDHKIVWEVNRHQHWLKLGRAAWLTGDSRYSAAFRREFDSWLTANPPLSGINWASMLELAFRSISWLWALHFFLALDEDVDQPWVLDLLLGLDRQLEHVARHLSVYFSPNTHLLGEALALYVAGRVLPELKSAARWEKVGRDILVRQARAQVHRDGGHAELSPHYHRYALDFYLMALAVARRTDDPAAGTFAEVAARMAIFCRALANDDGRLPTIGDDDGGMLFPICGRPAADASDSLSLAAALLDRPNLAIGEPPEEALWMLGGDRSRLRPPGADPPQGSRLFPDSGYAVIRSQTGCAVLDVGHLGFLNGGHAHADALSLVLSVHGRPLLIDPGTATYTTDPQLRDRFRSTAMHNTAMLDGRAQSLPGGPFHWQSSAAASVTMWKAGGEFDCVEAQHDGYLPDVHRRAVLRAQDELWLIADHVLGTGSHRIEAHWHLDPAWTASRLSPTDVRLHHSDGGIFATIASTARELTDFRGDAGGLGWCAPVYGQTAPSLTLRLTESGRAPITLITVVGAAHRPVDLSIEPTPVWTARQDGWMRAAVAGSHGSGGFVALFATEEDPVAQHAERGEPDTSRRELQRITNRSGCLTTDARIALLRLSSSGHPTALTLIDASVATWTGPGEFSLGPLASAEDLHLDQADLARLSHGAAAPNGLNDVDRTLCVE